ARAPPVAQSPRAAGRRDHHPQISNGPARGMLVARDRQTADEPAVLRLRDEDGRVRIAPDRAEITTLVADAAPAVLRREPTLRLRSHLVAKPLQLRCVTWVGRTDDEGHVHCTTTPAPPRRASPAAASVPSSRISTAAAPPK